MLRLIPGEHYYVLNRIFSTNKYFGFVINDATTVKPTHVAKSATHSLSRYQRGNVHMHYCNDRGTVEPSIIGCDK